MKKFYLPALLLLGLGTANAQTTDRLVLIEGFTSNTCPPCATFNAAYSPILSNNAPNDEANPGVAVLKFQMDWPSPGNDPSNNDDADTRRSFYGVSGIPDYKIDGDDVDGTQSQIDSYSANPAELEIEAAYTITGNTIDINVAFTPLVDLGGGSRLYIALANKSYNYSGGTNGETSFSHVFRKMIPQDAGISLGFLTAGTEQTFNESYTYTLAGGTPAQDSYDLWDDQFEIVVWVQKSNSKEVFNAAVASQGVLGVEEGDADDFGMLVFPNPVQDNATVAFDNNNEVVTLEVYNNLGQVVMTEQVTSMTGRQRVELNTTNLEAGMYFVKVQLGNKVSTTPLMVTK